MLFRNNGSGGNLTDICRCEVEGQVRRWWASANFRDIQAPLGFRRSRHHSGALELRQVTCVVAFLFLGSEGDPLWFRSARIWDVSTGPLACPFVHSHCSLIRLLRTTRLVHVLICSRAHSLHSLPSLLESGNFDVSKSGCSES